MQIRQAGPMSVATYMGLCLTHPRHGYYRRGGAIGASGDFTTASEISQMFGEMIGFFLVNLWQQMGEPKAFTLLELGPGRGTLMADILRVAARAPGFLDAVSIELFESDPALLAEQRTRLAAYNPAWIKDFALPADTPLLVVANEFFDALPIRQFVRGRQGWHERMVGLFDGKRGFGLSPTPIPDGALPEAVRDAPEGAVYEASLAAGEVMKRLAPAVARRGARSLPSTMGMRRRKPAKRCRPSAATPMPIRSRRPAIPTFQRMSISARSARSREPPASRFRRSRPRAISSSISASSPAPRPSLAPTRVRPRRSMPRLTG